ncbi:hypothetical protein GALMADRAFT_244289 [Galerina marginata CBS 339.88]|uniref:PARP catalytic domain-containing protein n=1 Tax=Galerina marginata (strain CBS 339.88) TaxID=685588 RepID=A0A067T6H6_GALM3|nr:hypothetical protein GALMADRAFT_244289 [Galerina marginata CBS 339.88]
MAVAGPSRFIDLTLESENDLFDHSASADFIDLTLDAEDYLAENNPRVASADPYQGSVIFLDDDDDIRTSTPFQAYGRKSRSKHTKIQEVGMSDDEFPVVLSSSAVASSSKVTVEDGAKMDYSSEDYGVLESWAAYDEEDERLARQLAQEEEESYRQLVETVENNKDGIVFSVVINAADNTLEDGSPAHADDLERFQPWKNLCEQSGLKVAKFHWFVNYELEKRFEMARDTLEAIMGERPPEMQLFHGTPAANIDSILQSGFRIGGVDGHPISHGTASGYGIYLAAAAATSLGYAMGGNKIFACRVVPGRTTKTPVHQPPPSVHVGSERVECYDGGGVLVHRYASLVLPCYMIEFDMPNQLQYNAFGGAPALGAGFAGGMMGGVGMFGGGGMMGAGMFCGGLLAAPLPPPLGLLPLPALPKPRARRTPRKAKPPTTAVPPIARKRTRKTAETEGAAVTPRKRQRKTVPTEDNEEEEAAARPTSSRKGKGKAKA